MKNLQYLTTKNSPSPIFLMEVFNFEENESKNLKSGIHLPSRSIHTAYSGTDTRLVPKLWKLIPGKIKHVSTLSVFKAKIKSWTTNNCQCRLCKIFERDLSFGEVCVSPKWNSH